MSLGFQALRITYRCPYGYHDLVFIEPTAVFLDWARRFPNVDQKLTLDELLDDNTAYLIPEQEGDPDTWLRRNFRIIFEIELDSWCTDRALWPKVRL